jgi:hypothetical protein
MDQGRGGDQGIHTGSRIGNVELRTPPGYFKVNRQNASFEKGEDL